MTRGPAAALRLAALLVLAGVATIAITWYGSGDERTASTQLPYVLVALGLGLGCTCVAAMLYLVARIRMVQHRLLDATQRREPAT